MLHSLFYAVVRLLLDDLIVRGRPNAGLHAEVLALRHPFEHGTPSPICSSSEEQSSSASCSLLRNWEKTV